MGYLSVGGKRVSRGFATKAAMGKIAIANNRIAIIVVTHRPRLCHGDQSIRAPITSATTSKVLGLRTAFPSSDIVMGKLSIQGVASTCMRIGLAANGAFPAVDGDIWGRGVSVRKNRPSE